MPRVLGAELALQVVGVDLPEVGRPADLDLAEVVFSVRVVVLSERVECSDCIQHRGKLALRERGDAACHHDFASDESLSEGIIQGGYTLGLLHPDRPFFTSSSMGGGGMP